MNIDNKVLATHLLNYLQQKSTLDELVNWAELALMDGHFKGEDTDTIRDILARLGLADVREFGLTWDDCNDFMKKLGYVLKIDAGLVA
jgi:hypothetical protein